MDCTALYLRIAPARISLLRFLLEGYDGLAILTTLDRTSGLVRLLVPGTRFQELMKFLAAVAPDLRNHDI